MPTVNLIWTYIRLYHFPGLVHNHTHLQLPATCIRVLWDHHCSPFLLPHLTFFIESPQVPWRRSGNVSILSRHPPPVVSLHIALRNAKPTQEVSSWGEGIHLPTCCTQLLDMFAGHQLPRDPNRKVLCHGSGVEQTKVLTFSMHSHSSECST